MQTPTVDPQELAVEFVEMGASFSKVALVIPDGMNMEDWADIGKRLWHVGHVMSWWIADWAAFGEKKWGALAEFARMNGIAEGTIRNLGFIARNVEASCRRDDLSIGHHEAVAPLLAKEQRKWLELAHEKGMSRSQLRTAIRQAKGDNNAREPDGPALHWIQDKPFPELVQWLTTQPDEFWTVQRKEWWKTYLRPLVALYESL